jgi:hypothetical protein
MAQLSRQAVPLWRLLAGLAVLVLSGLGWQYLPLGDWRHVLSLIGLLYGARLILQWVRSWRGPEADDFIRELAVATGITLGYFIYLAALSNFLH